MFQRFIGHPSGNIDHMRGARLYERKKFSEAEEQFRQAADKRERALGKDHKKTLKSRYRLGRALHKQKKYSEAEELLRQVVDRQERTLGRDHKDVIITSYWLGCSLYNLRKYREAEMRFQHTADGRERTLGKNHIYTRNCRAWLNGAIQAQRRYPEAKIQPQYTVDGLEGTLERDYKDTLPVIPLSQDLRRESSPILPINNMTQQALSFRLDSFFPATEDGRRQYTDSDIHEISSLLKYCDLKWSKAPRTYIVLRIISHLSHLNKLIEAGFSDYLFPVTERNLPQCLPSSVRAAFFSAQQLVLTKSMDLEKGEQGEHCYFKQEDFLPFEPKGVLGSGKFGQVDRVLSTISFKEYARKRVLRSVAVRGPSKEYMKRFISEIQILKRLKHHHIVSFVGSYTDAKYIGLIMHPVAEMDLATYLSRAKVSNHPELRTFFGCLASALEFLHEQKVRHKDIKPANILVNHGTVLFADFGLSLDFTEADRSTTMGIVDWMTPRYCAPEVSQYEPRNTKSDIWSLGVVFVEMMVVLKGKTIKNMDDFFKQRGTQQTLIHTNINVLPKFITELEGVGKQSDNRALGWIQDMLSPEQRLRPTAASLVTTITALDEEGERTEFCGICCVPAEEEFSDYEDE